MFPVYLIVLENTLLLFQVQLPTGPYIFPALAGGNIELDQESLQSIEFGWVGTFGPSTVTLSIYDPAGRLTAVITDEYYGPGRHEVMWHGRDTTGRSASSGIYFARLKIGDEIETRKLALIK